jgi:predicted DCC family thiol-disulfide oxidoreductase YuxK
MKVILFDGVCNLCNSSINWIIDHDKKNVFKFASLQSDYGKAIIKQFNLQGDYLDTVLLMDENRIYERSTAVLRIAKYLGGIYSLLYITVIIPKGLRNLVYNYIARNRYKWFGKQDACRIPTPELKQKFLG